MNLKHALKSEDTEQILIMQWAEYQQSRYPELKWLYHCPNGGSRNKAEAKKLRQMGVKAGVSDLCLPYPKGIYIGLYIEMKYGKNNLQETQKEFLSAMMAAGHYVATCYTAQAAINIIKEYLSLPHRIIYGEAYKETCEKIGIEITKGKMKMENNSIMRG